MVGVFLLLRPVVGLVTRDSATILLELSVSSEVSLNIFLLGSLAEEGRFVSKQACHHVPYIRSDYDFVEFVDL